MRPSDEDVIAYAILVYEYMAAYMMVPGRIENVLMIIDCKNLSVLNAPYAMLKVVLSTV